MAEKTRWKTMKKLLDAIREEARQVSDLSSIADNVTRRTIYNHLERLSALGLVVNEKGWWYAAEARRKFRTKNDYEVALNHSKFIMSGSEWRQGVAQYSTYALLQEFSIGLSQGLKIHDRGCGIEFFAHVQTGYPYLYKKFKEGFNFLKERGQFIKQIHKELFGIDHSELDDISINDTLGLQDPFSDHIPTEVHNEVATKMREKQDNLTERLDNALREMGGEIAVIFRQIEHGIPLKGYCDFCPDLELTIKE